MHTRTLGLLLIRYSFNSVSSLIIADLLIKRFRHKQLLATLHTVLAYTMGDRGVSMQPIRMLNFLGIWDGFESPGGQIQVSCVTL